jgi:methionine sulfoxide reductase heme-binding subunit
MASPCCSTRSRTSASPTSSLPLAGPYRPVAVACGIVALYLLLAVWASSKLQRRIGYRLWRRLHVLAFAVYGLSVLHGALAGSDAGTS